MSIGSFQEDPSVTAPASAQADPLSPDARTGVSASQDGEFRDANDIGRIRGSVKWFDVKKGFGFIVGPEGQDVFVHFSSIHSDGFRTLKDGEAVLYELHEGDKGYHALHVERVPANKSDKPKAQGKSTDSAPVSSVSSDGDDWRDQVADRPARSPARVRNLDGYVG